LTVNQSSERFLQQNTPTHFVVRAGQCPAVVGRLANAQLNVQSVNISRRHAMIEFDGNDWKVRDLGSTTGTKVNGLPISTGQSSRLQTGDQVQFGPVVLQVHIPGDSAAQDNVMAWDDVSASPSSILARDLPGSVSSIPREELGGLAQHRLTVLLQSASRLNNAHDTASLAQLITESAAAGTGSHRCILIATPGESQWSVLGQYPSQGAGARELEISRSLVAMARQGRIAQLQGDGDDSYEQPSIMSLNIRSAICAPIVVDGAVAAVLYLDTRGSETLIQRDAAAFCAGLSQLGGMALANLKRAELARQEKELRDELVAARTAQQQLIPASTGEVGAVRYVLEAVPGTIVAGDLFDIFSLGDDSTMVILGDVMGKGAAAGLMMATVQTFFRTRGHSQLDLPPLLVEANRFFHERFQGKGFVTLWIGLFHASTRRLRYVDAGHGHWCFFPRESGVQLVDSQGGPPVGALPDATYAAGELLIAPEDRIILFSDGLVEQHDDQGRIFGEDGALSSLSSSRSVAEDVQLLLEAHQAFRGVIPLSDDLTIASLELLETRTPNHG
jgi:serine phosphatase RsbU (regulator of sigma subunit)